MPENDELLNQEIPVQQETEESSPYADFYQGLLKDVPDGQKPIVEPYLKEWQSRVGKKFDELHSQAKPYESWKQFIDAGYEPDHVTQALNIVEVLNQDPKRIYDALAESLGLTGGQGPEQPNANGQPVTEVEDESPEPWAQKFEELEKGLTAIAQFLVEQQETSTQSQQEKALDQTLNILHEQNDIKRGVFDDRYVLTLMANGAEPEEAVEEFYKTVDQFASRRSAPAPTVLGNGGGLPSQQIDLNSLDSKATRQVVAQMLQAAKEQT